MKRIIFIISLFFLSLNNEIYSSTNIDHPDFAYPKQVIANADEAIKESLKANDSEQLIQALIQYSIAKLSISQDNLPLIINKIESIIGLEKDIATKNILYSFEAEILNKFFQENYYIYNRKQTTDSLSSDITEWSLIQIQTKINDLITMSVGHPEITSKTPISRFKKIIIYNKYGELLCPTIFNFLSNRAQSLCKNELSDKAFNELTKVELKYADNNTPLIINLKLKEYNTTKTGSDFYKYLDLYKQYQDNQYSGLILIDVPTYNLKDSQLREFYRILSSFQKRFPKYPFMKDIQNVINNLIKGNLNINCKGIYSSKEDIKVKAIVDNLNRYSLTLYQIPEKYKRIPSIKDLKKIKTIEIKSTKETPYRNDTIEVVFPKLDFGRYTIIPSYKDNGTEISSDNIDDFIVSDIQIFEVSTSDSNSQQIFVVDGLTGSPIKNGIVKIINQGKVIDEYKTNSDGIVNISIDNANSSCEIKVEKDNDKYLPTTYINRKNYEYLKNSKKEYCQIITDLGVYQPGDTINFAAICYYINDNKQYLSVDENFTVYLKGKNYNTSINLNSDNFGRINSRFIIPDDILNGNYNITVKSKDYNIGYKDIKIAEYKLPTFFVEFSNPKHRFNENDSIITFNGFVKTYSQVPLINTDININVYKSAWFPYWRGNSEDFILKLNARTDNNGVFSIQIPNDSLKDNKHNFYQYRIEASVTSLSGETQSSSEHFTIGKYSSLKFKDSKNFEVTSPIILPIKCESTEDDTPLCQYYILDNKGQTIASDKFIPQETEVDFSSIPSGKYLLTANILDGNSNNKNDTVSIVLYRISDKKCPVKSPLWVPNDRIKTNTDGKAKILFGSDTESNIYYYLYSDNEVLKQGWVKKAEGLHEISMKIPKESREPLTLSLYTIKDYNLSKCNVVIVPALKPEKLNVEIESFRDNVMSGSSEKWTIRFRNNNGNAIESVSILDIYNIATEKIAPNYFKFYPVGPRPFSVNIYRNWISPLVTSLYQSIPNKYQSHTIRYPQLNLYGMNIFNRGGIRYRTAYITKAYDSVAQSNDAGGYGGIVEEEKSNENPEISSESVNVRLGETKVALWNPTLQSDKNGNMEIVFEVPNYNGTWAMKLISYTKNLLTDNLSKEITSQKPIMVQPNSPQFLRKGDYATISGLVINATDTIQKCYTKIELFNLADSEIILTKNFENTLSANQQKNYAISFIVPDTVAMLGYRLKSKNSIFSDGEQNIIPVLESVSPIIESQPFYLNPNQNNTEIEIKDSPSSAKITLEYCDNPLWYCITALPSIFDNTSVTSTGLAHTIYAIFTAEGITKLDNNIKQAIEYWENNPADSMLISMLKKNPDLKIKDIAKSPWLNDAQQQTLQMKNISQLYNKEYISKIKSETIAKLQSLQNNDGGWSWYKNRESSYYITCNILQVIGRLKDLGFIDSEKSINSLIENGVKYIDNEIIKMYNRQKDKRDFSVFNYYAFVRSYFPEIKQSTTLKIFSEKAVKYFTSNWRKMSIIDKAFTAIFLEKISQHRTAENIIRSIKEFAIETPLNGTYWDNLSYNRYCSYDKVSSTSLILQAINAVNPKDNIIDSVRQWILLQKQTNDWGNSSMASDAIYSLLSTGSDWLQQAGETNIYLDSNIIKADNVERFTGYRKLQIKDTDAKTLVIERDGSSPAWGSLYSQYSAPMENIEAESIDDLSITKKLYQINGNELNSNKEFKVGDKIKVMLTIKSKRNLDYIVIKDERSATLAPNEQLSNYVWNGEVGYYREVKKSETNIFIDRLPKGTFIISYDATVMAPGVYNLGIATIQSEYAPQITAHSAGTKMVVTE